METLNTGPGTQRVFGNSSIAVTTVTSGPVDASRLPPHWPMPVCSSCSILADAQGILSALDHPAKCPPINCVYYKSVMFIPKSFSCQLCLILEMCDLINIETSSSQTVR